MKLFRYKYTALLLMVVLFTFGSCEEGESSLSQAVLASASALNFEGIGNTEQIITVYADAEWLTEVPEWVTVSPASGVGVTEVTITVSDNMRDGALDNPRKEAVVFKGETLASRAEVMIIQSGDKYRDVKDYSVAEIAALADETVVIVPDVTVMAITSTGFIISDEQNTNNIFVLGETTVNIGDKVRSEERRVGKECKFWWVE